MTTSSMSGTGTGSGTDDFTASEWTQRSVLGDLLQQKGLLIGAGAAIAVFFLIRGRGSKPEEKAARNLVREWRHVDEPSDVRDLLGENLPPIVRPALLMALEEIERQAHMAFRRLERQIEHL